MPSTWLAYVASFNNFFGKKRLKIIQILISEGTNFEYSAFF